MIISWTKYNIRQRDDILFDKYYPNPLFKVQQSSISLERNTLAGLVGFLSTNKSLEDAIRERHPKTDARQNNVALILLALFVL